MDDIWGRMGIARNRFGPKLANAPKSSLQGKRRSRRMASRRAEPAEPPIVGECQREDHPPTLHRVHNPGTATNDMGDAASPCGGRPHAVEPGRRSLVGDDVGPGAAHAYRERIRIADNTSAALRVPISGRAALSTPRSAATVFAPIVKPSLINTVSCVSLLQSIRMPCCPG